MRRVSPFKNGRLITVQNAEAIGTRLGLSPLASSLRNWRPAEPPTFSSMFGRKCVLFLSVKIVAVLGEIAFQSLPPLDTLISFRNFENVYVENVYFDHQVDYHLNFSIISL